MQNERIKIIHWLFEWTVKRPINYILKQLKMKQLLTMAIAAILFTSCKKETPAVVDNSTAANYYSIVSKSITKTGVYWNGAISITVSNDAKISAIIFKKVKDLTGLQTWYITTANGTYSKTFTEGSDVFSGDNPFLITIRLKNGRNVTDTVYFY